MTEQNIERYVMERIGEGGKKKLEEFTKHYLDHMKKGFIPDIGIPRGLHLVGGGLTFEITPTSLGEMYKVRCKCGRETDLTNYDQFG